MPAASPFFHGRGTSSVRRLASMRPGRRKELTARRAELLAELDRLDDAIGRLARQRHDVACQLTEVREELWPRDVRLFGRRPGGVDEPDLPPLPEQPITLWGRQLRSVCLALLRRAGTMPLRLLHVLLQRHGYAIDSPRPVQTLADALAHEVRRGRARRVGRGVYQVEPSWPQPRPSRHGNPPVAPLTGLDDRILDEPLAPWPAGEGDGNADQVPAASSA